MIKLNLFFWQEDLYNEYGFDFWKYKEDTAHDHLTVYQTACCDGGVMEVLEVLPIDEILKKVADSFSGWNIQGGGIDFEKEGHGTFQIFTTSHIVRRTDN